MSYFTVGQNAEYVFTEKKSRFIGRVFYTATESAAREAVDRVRRGDPEARHHVFAYRIREGSVSRMSDDGEPSGTGGAPVYNALKMNELEDVTVTVTRYFGGILLGTGGLTRAYAKAAAGALSAAGTAQMVDVTEFTVAFPYPKLGSVVYMAEQAGAVVTDRIFSDTVTLRLTAENDVYRNLLPRFGEDPAVVVTENGHRLTRKRIDKKTDETY